MQIQGVALKKKRLESDLEKLRDEIKDMKSMEDKVKQKDTPLWNAKDHEAEQLERDKRALSRGKLQRGPMFKNNKSGLKARIADLVNQLEENNQIIYLQKLGITDLQEEILTLVGKYQNGIA